MLDGLMGDLQKKQEDLKLKLADIKIHEEIENGAIQVSANANGTIENISIVEALLQDKEQLEDLLLVVINNTLQAAKASEQEASQSLISDMLPPGMDKLFGA